MALVNLGQPFPSAPSGWLNEMERLKAEGLFVDATVACHDSSSGRTQNPFRTHLCVLAAAGNEFLRSVLEEHYQQNQVRLVTPFLLVCSHSSRLGLQIRFSTLREKDQRKAAFKTISMSNIRSVRFIIEKYMMRSKMT